MQGESRSCTLWGGSILLIVVVTGVDSKLMMRVVSLVFIWRISLDLYGVCFKSFPVTMRSFPGGFRTEFSSYRKVSSRRLSEQWRVALNFRSRVSSHVMGFEYEVY